jgi:hypothetical protein
MELEFNLQKRPLDQEENKRLPYAGDLNSHTNESG